MSTPSRRTWYLPAVAAAAAVAAVATGIAIAASGGDAASPRKATPEPATGGQLVRNGDRAEVSGTVIAAPGRPVIYCPDLPQADIGYPPGKEPPPSCPDRLAVKLTGVDLDRLADPGSRKGVRFGRATLRGIWQDRTIAVDEQTPPSPGAVEPPRVDVVPCPAPPGGWKPGRWGDAGLRSNTLTEFVRGHRERFDDVRMAYPDGVPSTPPTILTEVVVVPLLTGDLEQARRELGKLYDGNLCVYRATQLFELDALDAANNAMDVLMRDQTNAVWSFSPSSPTKAGEVELLVLDERLYRAIDRIGFKYFDLKPSVRPV